MIFISARFWISNNGFWLQIQNEPKRPEEDILLSPPGCVFWNFVTSYISSLIMIQRSASVLCEDTSARVNVADIFAKDYAGLVSLYEGTWTSVVRESCFMTSHAAIRSEPRQGYAVTWVGASYFQPLVFF
jgi:hypothetical protein